MGHEQRGSRPFLGDLLDPLAETIDVRIGKFMEVTLGGLPRQEAEKRLRAMCEKLLANTVIEDYRFEIQEE